MATARRKEENQVCPTSRTLPSTSVWPSSACPYRRGTRTPTPPGSPCPILARQRELSRRLSDRLCAADRRIQAFLDDYLADTGERPQLPRRTLVLDEPGLARDLSLPFDGDDFSSPLLSSYRLVNGVLHNPANDRRTTAGVFHIAEGGLPIPDDKIAVPKATFARLLARAFEPPETDMVLPYTANDRRPAACFVSLLLRPLVSPGGARVGAREADGDPLHRARRHWSPTSTSSRASSATAATPTCPRTTRRWPRRPGPATPAASSSRRT